MSKTKCKRGAYDCSAVAALLVTMSKREVKGKRGKERTKGEMGAGRNGIGIRSHLVLRR